MKIWWNSNSDLKTINALYIFATTLWFLFFLYLCIYLSIYLTSYPSIYLSIYLPIYQVSIYIYIYIYIYIQIYIIYVFIIIFSIFDEKQKTTFFTQSDTTAANIRLGEDVLKASWRPLQHVFSVTFFCLPRRLEDVLKTSWRHNCNTSCKHVLKTSWRHFRKTYCKYVLKTSWKTKSVTLKTSWKIRNVCWDCPTKFSLNYVTHGKDSF